jgi:hypothetical protein
VVPFARTGTVAASLRIGAVAASSLHMTASSDGTGVVS